MRRETDSLGTLQLPAGALYGIATQRALINFPLSHRPVNKRLIHAFGAVKLAALRVNHRQGAFRQSPHKFTALEQAAREMMEGRLDEHIVVDALQGGAGTSTNMNVNEVIANRALELMGHKPGDYQHADPLEDVNRHQSTNDTYPTALRLAAIAGLRELQPHLIALTDELHHKEQQWEHIIQIGRTQLQDAVPLSLGRQFGAYAEAFARDRWRLAKCEERLRVVNLGGTAIGTGIGAPRKYIFEVTEELRTLTGFGLARAENLLDATQNADLLAEVSGLMRVLAVNLIKMGNDLRILASGPSAGIGELQLVPRQAGSTIMPGKVNPVIPEAVISAGMQVMASDGLIAQIAASGNLQLNHLMPLLADHLLGSIDLMTGAVKIMTELCLKELAVNEQRCHEHVMSATAIVTALSEKLGYHKAGELVRRSKDEGCSVPSLVLKEGLLTADELNELTSVEHVLRLGFSHKPKAD
jgi:aspartate ammonia-lyase